MKKTIFLLFLIATMAKAEVRLPSIIGSHMVLQQNTSTNLWGWCNPGEKISIKLSWDTTTYTTTGTGMAKWKIKIKTPVASGPHQITIEGNNKIVLDDIMIGEVWVCSGQSNMEWSGTQNLKQSLDEAPSATNTKIRFFYLPKTTAMFPQENCDGSWKVCSPAEMKKFSAVGYFFGKKLQSELNVAVGLINSNWGGTLAESWTPQAAIDNMKSLQTQKPNSAPATWRPNKPSVIYNAMIHPIVQHQIAGVIWYQGESNVENHSIYQELFSTMIKEWRKSWENQFPFYYVQIAPYAYGNNINGALLREAQTKSTSTPNTGMIVISDLVNDVKNIHPTNKIDVAERLANYALAETYGVNKKPYKSPVYDTMEIKGKQVVIRFKYAEQGLMSKNGNPDNFYIAGKDSVFYPAQAKIKNSTVIISSKEVTEPVAVRFGFTNIATPNLFTTDGLPVNIFRTDNWNNILK